MELAVEETLKTLKEGEAGDFNQALIETGAIVLCAEQTAALRAPCPFYTVCEARKGSDRRDPGENTEKERKIEEKTVLLVEYGDKISH